MLIVETKKKIICPPGLPLISVSEIKAQVWNLELSVAGCNLFFIVLSRLVNLTLRLAVGLYKL